MYNSNRHIQQLHAYKSHSPYSIHPLFVNLERSINSIHPLFVNLERSIIIRISIRDMLTVYSALRCSHPQ